MRCLKRVDAALYAEIARRRDQQDKPGDVLSVLLQAGMTDRELRDQLLTMLVAGHETTATALAWAFERILRHPDVLSRTRDGLALGDTTYLDAAIKETLRLRPVVPITARKLTVPFELDGRTYSPGTVLMPCIYLLHRNPDIYDEPESFRPERFLGREPPPYAWIPFGGGVRRCLGATFALAEMRAVMQTVLTRVELSAASHGDEAMARRAFTLSPSNGARVVVKRRLEAPGAAQQKRLFGKAVLAPGR
jgi:cytochrome P450